MVDVTDKYCDMIDRFCCDFSLARDMCSDFTLDELQWQINEKSNFILLNDIRLLNELSFKLRHNSIKILEE